MKRIINLTLTCVVVFLTAFSFVACDNESRLRQGVKEANAECPVKVSEYAEFTSVEYVDGKVQYVLTVDDHLFDLNSISANKQLAKSQIIMTLSNPNSSSNALLDLVKDAGADLVFIYKGRYNGKRVPIEISVDELNHISTDDYDAEANLQGLLDITNAQCPITLDEGLVMDRVYADGKHFVYHYITDDDVVDIDILRSNIVMAKEETLKELKRDQSVKDIIKVLDELDMDIRYVYESEQTGATAFFTVYLNELK